MTMRTPKQMLRLKPEECVSIRSGRYRRVVIALSLILLSGCAASRQEVASRLDAEYVGQNVDTLVVRFGPPSSSFKMNSGGSSYVWQLSAVTNIDMDRGSGTASTRYCKVSVITSLAGIVTDLKTEDSNSLLGIHGSICARRLGMKPTSQS